MRFRTTIILFGVFLILLAAFLFFESSGKKKAAEKERQEKFVDQISGNVQKMTLKNDSGTLSFMRDEKGSWRITEPLETGADNSEVNALADNFSNVKMERVVEAEPRDIKAYEIPKKELSLWFKGENRPIRILFGMENPLDQTLFAKRDDETKVVLLASRLKSSLDKKLIDFRQKDIFKFEPSEVKAIQLRVKDNSWQASKNNDQWELQSPIKALAGTSKIETLLDALAGLRAKEFVSENKTDEEIKTNGLDKPEYEAILSFPTANKKTVLLFQKNGERVCAADSASNKIILIDGSILTDMEKKVDEYREKKVAAFNSWEADRVSLKKNGLDLAAVKEKVKDEEKWRLETLNKAEADVSKIETFIRKIERLEAAEFVDGPKNLAEYGLDKPQAEIKIRVKENEGKIRVLTVLIGREDKDKNQVFVKNGDLAYLFKVDASFLQDLPKEGQEWNVSLPSDNKIKEKKE